MALIDLSLVTRAIVTLLEEHITASSGWSPTVTLSVTPEPADRLDGDHAIGLYLYHVTEDPARRNQGFVSGDAPPVQHQPMPLTLHYHLTAHSDIDGATGTYQEQLMFGLALKALHDHPVIDDETAIGGTPVLPLAMRGADNRLRIEFQQVTPDEARTFWAPDEQSPRLSAFFTVTAVLLEPEEPTRRPGRVLTPGVQVFASGAPRIDSSRSIATVTVPGEDPQEIVVTPAQAPYDAEVTFIGSGLAGSAIALALRHARWDDPVEVDASWGVGVAGTTLTATLREQAGAEDVLPGVHAAIALVTVTHRLPDGTTRDVVQRSNEAPFVILPRIDAVGVPDPAGELTITGHVFEHADLEPEDVVLFAGDRRLAPGTAGALAPGEFAVTSPSTIDVRLPAGLTAGDLVAVRVLVNGAESLPEWVTAP